MTTYTTIPDSDIDPESPGTTTLFTRLRDNPIAITEGAAGAPKIQTDAITDLSVTGAKFSKTPTSGSQAISASATWVPASGAYQFVGSAAGIVVELRVSGVWRRAVSNVAGELILCDGINMRLANVSGSSITVYYHKF